jgi:hypothetical protein
MAFIPFLFLLFDQSLKNPLIVFFGSNDGIRTLPRPPTQYALLNACYIVFFSSCSSDVEMKLDTD